MFFSKILRKGSDIVKNSNGGKHIFGFDCIFIVKFYNVLPPLRYCVHPFENEIKYWLINYLDSRALIGEWTAEEDCDDVHQSVGDVVLQGGVRVFPVVSRVWDDGHVEEEAPLEQLPHVVRRVDLLHLHLGVDVAVSQEVDVSVFDLKTVFRFYWNLKINFSLQKLLHKPLQYTNTNIYQ